jgi:hypothetical protein
VPVRVEPQGVLARADLPGPTDYVLVAHDQQQRRTALVLLQLFFLLTTVSLMLRPPRFAQEDRP